MNNELEQTYLNDLAKIKETITENRNKAMVVVNSAMIITYYQIGTIINQRKEWGNRYIKMLASDLKEYGKGYSIDQLKRMARFASYFSENEISAQAVHQIPWSTIIELMRLSSSKEEALWYVGQITKNKWSRSHVLKQFENEAYQRNLIVPQSTNNNDENGFQNEIFKDTLAFEFLSKNDLTSEKKMKDILMDNIILFLQELGPGFALAGKEYRLVTPTGKSFYVDLLMYHTKIHSYVVIEVKLGEMEPSDLGQLNFYVNAVDDLEKTEGDNNTVGILLCKSADNYVVKTSLSGINTQIGVSKYKVLEELPMYLNKRLKEID